MQNHVDTPVLLLGFNRADATRRVLKEIAKGKPKRLFFAVDGPRAQHAGEKDQCNAVRNLARLVDWDCELKTLFRDKNLGCRSAVPSAINWFFEHVDRGIILEDDCLPSPSFFPFCSALLDSYANDRRVMMIAGSNFQEGVTWGNSSYYFSRLPNIWGWATWRRAWKLFDLEMSLVEDFRVPNIIDTIFSDRNIALSWRLAFSYARTGKISSWAYPWMFTCLTQNGLSIVPNHNLVSNIGFGPDSTHTNDRHSRFSNVERKEIGELIHPPTVYGNEQADQQEYIRRNIFPHQEGMKLWYRYKRMRRARRFLLKIHTAYRDAKWQQKTSHHGFQ